MQNRGDLPDRIPLVIIEIDDIPVFGAQPADRRKNGPRIVIAETAAVRGQMMLRQIGERETALMPCGFEIIEAAVDG